jgi:hypothetical protein
MTTLKSYGSKMALHSITVYKFENSVITAFQSVSDGVVQLTGPLQSRDLTPCDFLVRGIMKNKVFSQRPTDLERLRTIIQAQFEKMDGAKNLCTTTVNCIAEHCQRCIEQNGKHFEQFLNIQYLRSAWFLYLAFR